MRNLLSLFAVLIFFSCNSNDASDDEGNADTVYLKTDTLSVSSELAPRIDNLIWLASFDSAKKHVVMKQLKEVNPDTLSAEKIIKDINLSWDGIKLEFKKISHDTMYVSIPESNTLTQGMGSSGAYNYISSTTFSLTELKNIKFVNYDFVEGDHMAPGTMKRSDFR